MSSRFLAVLAAVGLTTFGASSVYAMTLQEAVGLAISTNPEVGAVANDRLAVDEELRQGRALYYPQVDLRAEWWPIGDQGSTGSCVGWAVADSVLRWHFVQAGLLEPGEHLDRRSGFDRAIAKHLDP